ncbi:Coenzyme PQQ synthesis protein E [Candidatus Tiddalikarchaeum anstoanum]|nr:Coenzyme PQQ synthesis protein E [Candidatus Tiddalikarchaeum anstoanum]
MLQTLSFLKEIFINHRTRSVFWEITTLCNCKCSMCSLWKDKPAFLPLDEAKKIVDFMHDNGVIFVQLTGGEPTLYKDIIPLIKYLNSKNFILNLATNGTTMTHESAKELRSAGLSHINISFDYFNSAVQDKIRGLKGEFNKAVSAVNILKSEGFHVYSSSMINSYNWDKMEKLVSFVNGLGIPFGLCFPYPDFSTTTDNTSRLSKSQLVHALTDLLKLQEAGFIFANTRAFIEECLRFAKEEKLKYPCLAGSSVYGIKGSDFYTCWLLPKQFDASTGWNVKKVDCNKCHLSCYREISIVSSMLKHHPFSFIKEVSRLLKT